MILPISSALKARIVVERTVAERPYPELGRRRSACSHQCLQDSRIVVPGRALGEDEYVVGVEEKTSVQARCRCHLGQMR